MRNLKLASKSAIFALIALLTFDLSPAISAEEISWTSINLKDSKRPIELALNGLPKVSNPFDPEQADLWVSVTTPAKTILEIPLFWYQEFRATVNGNTPWSTAVGDPGWRVRFRSDEIGTYQLNLHGTINGAPISAPSYLVSSEVKHSSQIQISGRGFKRDNAPFVPIAYNIAWANRHEEKVKYERWFKAASAGGVNVARVWMASWDMGIEWIDTGLGDYSKRLGNAWALDQVFELGAKYDVSIDLVLLNHGAFSESTNPEWFGSPYNIENGGPLKSPSEFATNATAKKFWERRLRYIAARYSASPSLFTWEWWNEVNFTPISEPDLTTWMNSSKKALYTWDPYKHMTTTSWSSAASVRDWSPVDFVSTHVYDSSDPIKSLRNQYEAISKAVPDKPILVAEMGSGTTSEDPFSDPFGLHLHNSQWAGLFVGFGAPASYWWWDNYVDPLKLWSISLGLKKLITGTDPVNMTPEEILGPTRTTALLLKSPNITLGWIRHNDYQLSAKASLLLQAAITALKTKKPIQTKFSDPIVKAEAIKIPVAVAGNYVIRFMETKSGKAISTVKVTTVNTTLKVTVPKFTGDIAFRVEKGAS
jgi:hypothetical protein